jgi:hypothetical protein
MHANMDLTTGKPALITVGPESQTAVKELWENLGFRLIDDRDWMFDENGARVSACGFYWLILSGHDDERSDTPIRYGQWPQAAEFIIKQLWHRCVTVAVGKAKREENHGRLSVAAGGVIIGSFVVPLLLAALHMVNAHQVDRLWHYGTYLSAAGLGALIAGWWISD